MSKVELVHSVIFWDKCWYFCSSTDCKYFCHICVQGEKWALCFISVCTLCPAADNKRLWAPRPQLCRLAMIVLLLLLLQFIQWDLTYWLRWLCVWLIRQTPAEPVHMWPQVVRKPWPMTWDALLGTCRNTHSVRRRRSINTLVCMCRCDDAHVRKGGWRNDPVKVNIFPSACFVSLLVTEPSHDFLLLLLGFSVSFYSQLVSGVCLRPPSVMTRLGIVTSLFI